MSSPQHLWNKMSVVELPLMESQLPLHDFHLLRLGAGIMKADSTLLVGIWKSSSDSASCSNSGSVIEGLPCINTHPSTTTPNKRREVRAGDKDLRTPALVISACWAFRVTNSVVHGDQFFWEAFMTRSWSKSLPTQLAWTCHQPEVMWQPDTWRTRILHRAHLITTK